MDFFTFYYMGNELAMAIKHLPILILILIISQWQKSGIFGLFTAEFGEFGQGFPCFSIHNEAALADRGWQRSGSMFSLQELHRNEQAKSSSFSLNKSLNTKTCGEKKYRAWKMMVIKDSRFTVLYAGARLLVISTRTGSGF